MTKKAKAAAAVEVDPGFAKVAAAFAKDRRVAMGKMFS